MEKETEPTIDKGPSGEKEPEKTKAEELAEIYDRAKELLGGKFDEDRVDEVIVLQSGEDLDEAFADLKRSLEKAADEAEKDRIREDWLEKNNMQNRLGE